MNSSQDILKLIREVDQGDTKKLDEIDARVWCYLNSVTLKKPSKDMWKKFEDDYTTVHYDDNGVEGLASCGWAGGSKHIKRFLKYTRSRDALKTIRPEGWAIDSSMASTGCDATCYMYFMVNGNEVFGTDSFSSETEELAELYAIIQAIEYERTKI